MNRNLQYSVDFPGAIWFDGSLQLNTYSVSLQMITANERPIMVAVALERIKAFVMGELANVLFINSEYHEVAELFDALGANVCILPADPNDPIIGIMLYCKLLAITEGNLLISHLDISSTLGGEIWYSHSDEDELGVFAKEGWWHHRGCQTSTLSTDQDSNVLKVDTLGWQEYGLDWPDVNNGLQATIVKPDFKRNETNTTR